MNVRPISLPNLPTKRAADFELLDFNPPRYARVVYSPQESKSDRAQIEAQAFEVDGDGALIAFSTGAASRTSGTTHVISKSGLGDTHTLTPGWVRVVGDFSDAPDGTQQPLPDGTSTVDALPPTGEVGDYAYKDGTLFRWDDGMINAIMRGKAEELAGLLRNAQALGNFEL